MVCCSTAQCTPGCKLINLLGSHGSKSVAAALLGARVTCVDISAANVAYGEQLAAAAGVNELVQFVVADVLPAASAGSHR